jgi:NodT family efflux transporter outer membrane factor (OMF) lipoprotein
MPAHASSVTTHWPHWLALACLPGAVWADTAPAQVAIPAQWHAEAVVAGPLDNAALANWWTRFNDPVLDRLIAEALRQSPDIRTALSKIAAARAAQNSARSGLFPSINANASGSGSRTQFRKTDVTTTAESYGASLDASWEIDLFGKQRLALSAAQADLAQTTEYFHAAQVSLAAEVATAYVTLRSTEVQLVALENSVAAQAQTEQVAQWREQAGLTSGLDAQQAVSALEQARASLPSLRQTLSETRNRLATLCGRAPGELDSLLATTSALPVIPASLAVGIPAETLRQRPDIRAAERGVEATLARTKAAQRERLPSLSLSGSLGVESLKAGDIFSPDRTLSRLLGSLTAPIFAGGRIKATIAMKTETGRQALIAYESAVLSALAEVENAQTSVARTAERLDSLTRAATAAREAATLAAQKYQAGEADMLVALDAQRTSLALDQQQVAAAAARLTAHIQLYKSLGGGWTSL